MKRWAQLIGSVGFSNPSVSTTWLSSIYLYCGVAESVEQFGRHSGRAGDSRQRRISLRLKLARPGIQENQKLLDTRFRGYDGGGRSLFYFANFSSRTLAILCSNACRYNPTPILSEFP
jgi:hypothetical protein